MMPFLRKLLCLSAVILGTMSDRAVAQSFQIGPSQVDVAIAPGFNHADLRIPITGTAPGFNFQELTATSDAAWIRPSIDGVSREVVLAFTTAGLLNSSNTATITVTGSGTTDFFSVRGSLAPLNVTKLLDDPVRSRTYGIHQDGLNTGAVVVIDPLTNTPIASVTVGKKPTDLAVARDGGELLVINAADKSITAIDLATLRAKETILLSAYLNWGVAETTGDVAYGPGNIIYYTDGSWAPVLYVYDRVTKQVIQQVTDDSNGIGDFALAPDNSALFAWIQYGWSAGFAGSYLVKYSVSPNGMLTFVERTSTAYPTVLDRDPLDTPVLIDAEATCVFAKQLAVDPAAIKETKRSFPGPVYSITGGGEIAVTSSAVYQVSTNVNLMTLPVNSSVQAVTSDYARLIYFDKTSRTIGTINLIEAIGPSVLNRELFPADGAITLAPSTLRWTPLPGVDRYRVYLGLSETEVQNARPGDATDLGEVNNPSMALVDALTAGAKYFWRIDALTVGGTAKGDVYEFTVSPIGTDVTRIDAATVRGHSNYQVDVHLASAEGALAWQASADQPWVGFEASSGSTPGTLVIRLNASQLLPGVHTAKVAVALGGGAGAAFTLPITLQVDPLALTVMESDRASAKVYALSEEASVNGAGTRAYLLEIDTDAKTINRVIRVGSSATDLAVHNPDGRVYVANWRLGTLLAIDQQTFRQVRGYGFTPWGSNSSEGDVYRIAAGTQGRLMVEEQDQWIDMSIFDTVSGSKVKSAFVREGGGEYSPGGRFYYHGDNNISNAEIHKYDVIGDVFTETAHTRVESVSYYGSRTVVVSEDGERVFWNGALLDKNLALQWLIGDEIFSTSTDGKFAFSSTRIYDVDLRQAVLSMPATTRLSAYNSTTDSLVLQVGTQIGFYDLGGASPLTAPVLAAAQVTKTSVQLKWTDESLESGFTLQKRAKGDTQWQDISSSIPANTTGYTVLGLSPDSEYEFRVKADSSVYTSAWSNVLAVTTLVGLTADVITSAASDVFATGATLNGTVNPKGSATTAYFEFGPTADYGSTTASQIVGNGNATIPVAQAIIFLQPSTSYHFRLVAVSSDVTIRGGDQVFTTLPAKPDCSLSGVTGLTSTSATLRGEVRSNGSAATAHFEYGLSPLFGRSTTDVVIGAGAAAVPIAQEITSLAPDTTYYYRLVAENVGGIAFSPMSVFKTAAGSGGGTLIAVDDLAFAVKGHARTIAVMANDSGAAGSPIRLLSVGRASVGNATVNSDGTVNYLPGAAFAGVDSFTYTIGDDLGHTALATVVVKSTYESVAGVYHTLIGSNSSRYEEAGAVILKVGRTGVLTGKLSLAGVVYPLKSELRHDGSAAFSIADSHAGTILLALQIDPASQELSGNVSAENWTVPFSASRVPYNALNRAPYEGRYTLLLPPGGQTDEAEGYGYAKMHLNVAGGARIIGRTRNGAPFTTAAFLNAGGQLPLYVVAKEPAQMSMHGWTYFRNVAGTSDFDALIGSSEKGSGASALIPLIGSRYFPPQATDLILPFSARSKNAVLEFGQGTMTELAVPVTLSATGIVSSTAVLSNLTVNPRAGLFAGTRLVGKQIEPFFGAVFQRQELGAGVFVRKSGAGWVRLVESQTPFTPAGTHGSFSSGVSIRREVPTWLFPGSYGEILSLQGATLP